jgi:hypothetical protein
MATATRKTAVEIDEALFEQVRGAPVRYNWLTHPRTLRRP